MCDDTAQYRGTRASPTLVGMVTEAEKLSSLKFHMNTQLLLFLSSMHSFKEVTQPWMFDAQLKEKRALQLCVRILSHLSKLFHKMFTFLLRFPLP